MQYKEENKRKYVHIIGICGVTMAPLAVLYKNMGWKVTGSDRAFFPPMSTYLEANGVKIMPGFKKDHLRANPDMVLVMAFITEKNPEIVEAKKRNIPIKVYADVLPNLIEKNNSIVIAGDCGKTSTTALVTWILETAGFTPNFMIGGLPQNFEHGIRKTHSEWSVIEGDEYVASSWDKTPRFFSYKPKYLILTDIRWDHMDKYKSEEEYIGIFEKLIKKVPKNGAIIANKDGKNIDKVIKASKAKVIFYSHKDIKGFPIPFKGKIWEQNSAAAIKLAKYIGIEDEKIRKALKTFSGVKRRQEARFKNNSVVVIDDNAHSPVKVSGGLEALSKMYPGYESIVIYEPGNRSDASLDDKGYRHCFSRAARIILPKVSSASNEVQEFNKKLRDKLKGAYRDLGYIDNDEEIISQIKKQIKNTTKNKGKLAIIFMSQKGFRGMIDRTISLLQ